MMMSAVAMIVAAPIAARAVRQRSQSAQTMLPVVNSIRQRSRP